MFKKLQEFLDTQYTTFIFTITFFAVIGSLYFSDVLLIEPCYLCWWQRIFIYPIFLLTLVSLLFKIRLQKLYILALSVPGFIFALYHYLLQTFGLFKEFSACTGTSRPCDVPEISYFGFITIPFLSLLALIAINFIVILSIKKSRITFWKKD